MRELREIDADKLVKDFEKAKEGCKQLHELLFFDGAMAIVDNQPIVCGWIPCSERLPENQPSWISGEIYIISLKQNRTVKLAKYKEQKWIGSFGRVIPDDDVIAWQPLPEPYNPELLKESAKC